MSELEAKATTAEQFAKDSLLESAADAQRTRGVMPTVADNERYLSSLLERMDARKRDDKPAPAQVQRPPREQSAERMHAELKTRTSRTHTPRGRPVPSGWQVPEKYSVVRGERTPILLGGPTHVQRRMDMFEQRLRTRVQLLLSKPDWADKFYRLNPLAWQGQLGESKKQEAQRYILRIIADSNATFGHWAKPPPDRPVYSYDGIGKRG